MTLTWLAMSWGWPLAGQGLADHGLVSLWAWLAVGFEGHLLAMEWAGHELPNGLTVGLHGHGMGCPWAGHGCPWVRHSLAWPWNFLAMGWAWLAMGDHVLIWA